MHKHFEAEDNGGNESEEGHEVEHGQEVADLQVADFAGIWN